MKNKTQTNKKNLPKKAQKEQINLTGKLGGEVSNELGFGTLEAAKNWIDDKYHPWNQEELEMLRQEFRNQNSNSKKNK